MCGKLSRYGISLHPPSGLYSYVKYVLKEGEYETFNSSVALNDDVTEAASDVIFEVVGDDKVLWTSPPIKTSQLTVPVSVNISSVKVLQLRCRCKESNSNAHAVWVDPSLRVPQPCFYDREVIRTVEGLQPDAASPRELASYLLALLDQFSVIQLQAMRRVNTSGDKVAMSLVEPYCIDVSTRTFTLLTELLHLICDRISNEMQLPNYKRSVSYEAMAIATINLVKVNLRRLVVARINPETIGIKLLGGGGEKAQEPTLRPLHNILKRFLENEEKFSDSLGKAASAAIDAGLEVFYPTPEERRVLLETLTKAGATLEVQFRWPTEVEKDKNEKKKEEGHADFDIRFERVILLLEVEFGDLDWNFMLHGHWGSFIHLVVEIPDNRSSTAIDFLDEGLKRIMSKAGFNNWSFPIGCEDPQIILKIERYLKFNRNERLVSEAGLGWFRIYPRHAGTFNDICNEVTSFLDNEVEEGRGGMDINDSESKENDLLGEEKGESKE